MAFPVHALAEGAAPVDELIERAATARRSEASLGDLVLGLKCGGSDGLSGLDAVSSTALAAAGATLILFTTGRGTPLGFPAPTVKISSNSALAERKAAGSTLTPARCWRATRTHWRNRCSKRSPRSHRGADTAAERKGEREIAIWKRGVTL